MARGFIKLPSDKGYLTLPSQIFEDSRVSIGAKGLYAQLYYSNKTISSIQDLVEVTSSTKEELDTWLNELSEIGYFVMNKDGTGRLVAKTQGEKTVAKKLDKDAIEEFANKTVEKPKPMSAFEKLMGMIESYHFNEKVESLLKEYFINWLNGVGRYGEGDALHGPVARSCINTLVSFNMSDEDMITCIKKSIDMQWRKFVDHRLSSPTTVTAPATPFKKFDKSTLTSGSYTEEDIEDIKRRAAEYEANGKKGLF